MVPMTTMAISVLDVHPGDVLVVRGDAGEADLHDLRDSLRAMGKAPVLILRLAPEEDLELLDEGLMRLAGWVRAPREASPHHVIR